MRIDARNTENIMLVLLFFFTIGLFNMSGPILVMIILFFLIIAFDRKIVIDKLAVILFFFSVFYFINYSLFWSVGMKEIITYLFAPWCCFLVGENMVLYSKNKEIVERIVLVLILGFFLHGGVNFYVYVQMYGLESYGMGMHRVSYDFWRKEVIAVTACALYYVPMISLSLGYLFCGKKIHYKVISLVAIMMGIFVNVAYANRTVFGIIIILILIKMLRGISKSSIAPRKVLMFLLTIVGGIACWSTDLFGLQSYIMKLNITQRFMSNDTGRIEVWNEFLKSDWWRYPFGGQNFNSLYKYAHNLWFDTLNTVGIIPFLLLVLFSIGVFSIMTRGCRGFKIEDEIYLYLITGVAISCALEPIIEANPYYFLTIIIIVGALKGKQKKRG